MSHTLPAHAKDAFSTDALERVAVTIGEVERKTSAEIRISILDERDTSDAGLTIEALAKKEFFRLEMEKTKQRSGVLLLILYSERAFYVYGDTGINDRVQTDTWTDIAETLSEAFAHGQFEEGLHGALRGLAAHLETALPYTGDNNDELTNEVHLG